MFRHLCAAAWLAALPVAAGTLPAVPPVSSGVALDCRAVLGSAPVRWQVELHDALPLAVVDGEDVPAAYAPSHATLRLAASGPSLFIGRATGRLVISDGAGATLGRGQCSYSLAA